MFAMLLLQGLSSKDKLRPTDGNGQGAREAMRNYADAQIVNWNNSMALKTRMTSAEGPIPSSAQRQEGKEDLLSSSFK